MLKIYICEDNQIQLNYITNIVKNYLLMELREDYFYYSTTNPYSLIEKQRQTKGTGLYFLDIDLHSDITGLQLAAEIRQYDPRGYIVFITTHDEMLPLTFAYKVEAMDYILKEQNDLLSKRIIDCIQAAVKAEETLQAKNNQLLSIKLDNIILQINQDDIVLIESDEAPHKLVIHTTHGIKRMSGSLKVIQTSLNKCFHRCHNSTIVNIHHVISFNPEKRILMLDNGDSCPVSFRYLRLIRSALYNSKK